MSREMLLPEQAQMILDKGLVHGNFELRSGQRTKTKFDFDRIEEDSPELDLIVWGLTTIIEERMPHSEAIVSVADGATRLGAALGQELGLPHLQSTKTPNERIGFHIESPFERRQTRTVLIDDVYTAGTNLNEISRAAYAAGLFVIGAAVILDRSPSPRPTIKPPESERYTVQRLIKHPIPTYESR